MRAAAPRVDVKYVADLLASGKAQRIIIMCGAGVSTSANIPDFRSPGTGLYDNLQSYGLPFAEAIFDIEYFAQNPKPFYRLCKELWPGRYSPTAAHRFIRLLEKKGILLRCFTQNIDSLETAAGVSVDKVVAAHGNFDGARVVGGGAVPIEEVKFAAETGDEGWRKLNKKYGGLVKPNIVFFGEPLPRRFFELARHDFPNCDLLLIMGTSLVVQPFAGLVGHVNAGTPRLLINRDRVGENVGLDFTSPSSTDGFVSADCDETVREIVRLAGWQAEFDALESAADAKGRI